VVLELGGEGSGDWGVVAARDIAEGEWFSVAAQSDSDSSNFE
jgi:hypothetical protein